MTRTTRKSMTRVTGVTRMTRITEMIRVTGVIRMMNLTGLAWMTGINMLLCKRHASKLHCNLRISVNKL